MTAAAFTFAPMPPEIEGLYQRLMEHADNCMGDVQTHEFNLALHTALCGNAFPGLKAMGRNLVAQSVAMELEAREMAYLLLKSSSDPTAAQRLVELASDPDAGVETPKPPKPRPYYRPGRW